MDFTNGRKELWPGAVSKYCFYCFVFTWWESLVILGCTIFVRSSFGAMIQFCRPGKDFSSWLVWLGFVFSVHLAGVSLVLQFIVCKGCTCGIICVGIYITIFFAKPRYCGGFCHFNCCWGSVTNLYSLFKLTMYNSLCFASIPGSLDLANF